MASYDYIIVGAGSAGCVLANRLSENPNNLVCLIEAGKKDTHPAIHIPFGLALMSQLPSINYNYQTQPENQMKGREMYWPRGKTLGGSSSINAMCYIRGNPENYNDWASDGCKGWDWESVLPYFRKSENNTRGISRLHGSGGPQTVSDLKHINPVSLDFVRSAILCGTQENSDFNGITQEGVGLYQVTQRDGARCSTAKGFLSDKVKLRRNLTILTNTEVRKIELEDSVAKGVELTQDGEPKMLFANKEVIVSAGAINSPQLLMQSGIGPGKDLAELGIPLKQDLAGVGKNLQDHLDGTMLYRQSAARSYGLSVRGIVKNALAPYQYWRHKAGMLSSNIAEGGAFIKSDASKAIPDIQIHFLPALLIDHGRTKPYGHGFTFHFCNLYPKSKGDITLSKRQNDFTANITPNYLSDESDINAMVAGFKWSREVASKGPLSEGSVAFLPSNDVQTDDEIIDYIRGNAETVYHPVGTCKMGADDDNMAVVNSQLQVKGVSGLRVVDASVMPTIVGGNTNAPTIMIAEKAADMILNEG